MMNSTVLGSTVRAGALTLVASGLGTVPAFGQEPDPVPVPVGDEEIEILDAVEIGVQMDEEASSKQATIERAVEIYDRRYGFLEADLRLAGIESAESHARLRAAYDTAVAEVVDDYRWNIDPWGSVITIPRMADILEHPAWTARFDLETQDESVRNAWNALQTERRARLLAARTDLVFARFRQEFRLRPEQAEALRPALAAWVETYEPETGRSTDVVHAMTRRMQGEDSVWATLTPGQKSYLERSREQADSGRAVGRMPEDEFILEAEALAQRHGLDEACLATLSQAGRMLGRRSKISARNHRRQPFACKLEPSEDEFWIKLLRTEAPQAIGDTAASLEAMNEELHAGRTAVIVASLDARLHLTQEQREAVPEAVERLVDREIESYRWRFDELGPQYVMEALGVGQPHLLGGANENTNHSSVVRGAREALRSILTPAQIEELGL